MVSSKFEQPSEQACVDVVAALDERDLPADVSLQLRVVDVVGDVEAEHERVGGGDGVVVDDPVEQRGQHLPRLRVQDPDGAEVQQPERAAVQEHDVAGVQVCVEDPRMNTPSTSAETRSSASCSLTSVSSRSMRPCASLMGMLTSRETTNTLEVVSSGTGTGVPMRSTSLSACSRARVLVSSSR